MGQDISQIAAEAAQALIDEGHTSYIVGLCEDAWSWLSETYGNEDRELDEIIDDALGTCARKHRQALSGLKMFAESGEIFVNRANAVFFTPERFAPIIAAYRGFVASQRLAPETRRSLMRSARRLLCYIDGLVDEIVELEPAHIASYLEKCREERTPKSASVETSNIRRFLEYLRSEHGVDRIPETLLRGQSKRAYPALPTGFTAEELSLLVEAAAHDGMRPKMKTLLVLLYATYGLRASEASGITIDAIDWNDGTITIPDRKNGRPLTIQLVDSVRYALLDYIKNERPECADRHVFLTRQAPHRPYASGSRTAYFMVARLCAAAGIDVTGRQHGPHAIRHAVATAMLEEGVAYATIREVLGQTGVNTTRAYLAIDIELLRRAAVEVPAWRL